MRTTTYGYKVPETGDKGPVVFPALVEDIDRIDGHDHEGTNSKPLSPKALSTIEQTILAANWVLVANGIYKQTVLLPSGLFMDKVTREFWLPSGELIFPTIIRIDNATFDIYINDNTQNVRIVYK